VPVTAGAVSLVCDDKCRPAQDVVKIGDATRQMRTSQSSLDRRT
jgi:hypothetical protein